MTRSLRIARSAAIAYTVTFVAGSYLSIKRGYPARALGIDMGSDVRRGVVGGIHGPLEPDRPDVGVARPGPEGGREWPAGSSLARLSLSLVCRRVGRRAGEPQDRDSRFAAGRVAVANIVLPILMLVAALASLVDGEGECS